jgi:hypothetical protein
MSTPASFSIFDESYYPFETPEVSIRTCLWDISAWLARQDFHREFWWQAELTKSYRW